MTRSVVFVTTELPPAGSGGAGAVVARTRRLLEASGHRVTVILVGPDHHPDPNVVVVPATDDPVERSRLAAAAVADLAADADLVEFQDFYGLGFEALTGRVRYGLESTTVAVRLHGPMASILRAIGHSEHQYSQYVAMERHAMAMADVVFVPSVPMADYAREAFGIDADRIVVAEPATAPDVERVAYTPGPHPEIVFFGKLAEVKGTLTFAEAAASLLAAEPELRVRFVGGDAWSFAEDRSMAEIVREVLPDSERVRFEPPAVGVAVGEALAGTWLVVIPSLFETFCLAAHDVAAAGLPLVVSDIAAFDAFFTEDTGAARFDGTAAGLASAIKDLLDDPRRRRAMAAAPLPAYADPTAAYREQLPPARHPQSQAGLATIASKEVEALEPKPTSRSRWERLAGGLLRRLPRPMAALAIKVVPSSWKVRFRSYASWPQEEARRARSRRHEGLRADGLARGAVPEPDVSIIIPCFNQGEWLPDALASVYEQDHGSWEIVVVDDGSTDPATVEAIDAAGDLLRVSVVRQENRGLPAARNAGIRAARGRMLVPLDADDELGPGFLREMTEALESRPGAAFSHCWAEMYGDLSEIWVTRPFNLYQLLMGNSIVGCVMLRRDAFEAVGGYDETMTEGNEDWELWVRLLLAGWQEVAVRRPLFRYRRRGASMSAHTEARFEQGRRQVAERHRDAYRPDALATMKRGWYPAVSLLTAGPEVATHTLADCEVILVGGEADEELSQVANSKGWPVRTAADLNGAVAASRGKYVAGPGVEWADDEALTTAAKMLEAAPTAAAVVDDAGSPVLWRRWALIDASSPHPGTVPGGSYGRVVAPSGLARGAHTDPQWEIPRGLDPTLPIHRQSPEVEGFVPTI